MLIVVAATLVCLIVLYICYRALPLGRPVLLGIAAVVTALAGLLTAFTHLL